MHRKIVVILVTAISLFMLCNVASADVDFDATQYSLEELYEILAQVNQELQARNETVFMPVYSGKLYAGKDIVPGSYIIKVTKVLEDDNGRYWIYDNADECLYYGWLKCDEQFQFSLAEGESIELYQLEAELRQAPLNPFAP